LYNSNAPVEALTLQKPRAKHISCQIDSRVGAITAIVFVAGNTRILLMTLIETAVSREDAVLATIYSNNWV